AVRDFPKPMTIVPSVARGPAANAAPNEFLAGRWQRILKEDLTLIGNLNHKLSVASQQHSYPLLFASTKTRSVAPAAASPLLAAGAWRDLGVRDERRQSARHGPATADVTGSGIHRMRPGIRPAPMPVLTSRSFTPARALNARSART